MNSAGLERWQIERVFKRVQHELHYLDRLEGRMQQKHFPADDPVYARVKTARVAVHDLASQLRDLLEIP